ncbi:MAG: SUMF1/EgtB/PvdO family nonheme iron enzyme [Verrucomicrobiota bacterium]
MEWEDVAAYADWTGLRPVSELEYEKASRGSIAAVPNEFASGTPFVFDQGYSLANAGTPSESIQNGGGGQTGNALYSDTNMATFDHPFRSGIFASSAPNPTRVTTGGSYYGVMELSGNLWEITVSVGHPEGRAFGGAFHGNGIISSSGVGTVASWPEDSASSSDYGDGLGLRGGSFLSISSRQEISNRELANFSVDTRLSEVGARLGRTGF